MTNARMAALSTLVLASAAGIPVFAQSVVSTHSGLIYFFVGSVYLGDEHLEQKFGRFPDIGEGHELRTALGRVEVLLTPGVFLRLDENSSIRMLATVFSDTRVELLSGSAIFEVTETSPDTSVKLIYKNWQIRVPQEGTYRIDTAPPRIRPYKGEVKVGTEGITETVIVREGEVLPLAEVLVPERSATFGNDDFKLWAMTRSQAISADNTVAAGIVDDPSQIDSAGLVSAGYTYFPLTGIPSLDIGSPYGLSFWSPFQSTLSALYFPPYLLYGPLYGGWPRGGWLGGTRPYPGRTVLPTPIGLRPPRTGTPRLPVPSQPAPHTGVHVVAHH
jgi:hypothetical protein